MARLLIIDNDEIDAKEIKDWLLKEGHIVDICKSGAEGFRRLQKFEYDVAVIDWNLPDLKGPDMCRRVCSSNLRLPILLLGQRNAAEDAIAGLDAGAQDYVPKPTPLPEIAARLRSLLRRYGGSRVVVPPAISMNPIVIQ